MAMEEPVLSQSSPELNVYISSASVPRPTKETTFREWVVNNQIGMNPTANITPVYGDMCTLGAYVVATAVSLVFVSVITPSIAHYNLANS